MSTFRVGDRFTYNGFCAIYTVESFGEDFLISGGRYYPASLCTKVEDVTLPPIDENIPTAPVATTLEPSALTLEAGLALLASKCADLMTTFSGKFWVNSDRDGRCSTGVYLTPLEALQAFKNLVETQPEELPALPPTAETPEDVLKLALLKDENEDDLEYEYEYEDEDEDGDEARCP